MAEPSGKQRRAVATRVFGFMMVIMGSAGFGWESSWLICRRCGVLTPNRQKIGNFFKPGLERVESWVRLGRRDGNLHQKPPRLPPRPQRLCVSLHYRNAEARSQQRGAQSFSGVPHAVLEKHGKLQNSSADSSISGRTPPEWVFTPTNSLPHSVGSRANPPSPKSHERSIKHRVSRSDDSTFRICSGPGGGAS